MVQGGIYRSLVRWGDVRGVWCEDKGWTGIRWGRKHAQWARWLPAYVERLGWTWKMKRIKHKKKKPQVQIWYLRIHRYSALP
jgi:hypothetical protein